MPMIPQQGGKENKKAGQQADVQAVGPFTPLAHPVGKLGVQLVDLQKLVFA